MKNQSLDLQKYARKRSFILRKAITAPALKMYSAFTMYRLTFNAVLVGMLEKKLVTLDG